MSTSSSSWELQAAVKAALAADAGLIVLTGDPVPLFDCVPQGTARPYLAIAEWRTDEDDADDVRIDRHTFSVRISSAYEGLKEAKGIAAQVEAALHRRALTLAGHVLVDLAFLGAGFGREENGTLTFGEVRFRAFTHAV